MDLCNSLLVKAFAHQAEGPGSDPYTSTMCDSHAVLMSPAMICLTVAKSSQTTSSSFVHWQLVSYTNTDSVGGYWTLCNNQARFQSHYDFFQKRTVLIPCFDYRGAESMIHQAREWESSGEYARAVECYVKVTNKMTDDARILEKCWMKVRVVVTLRTCCLQVQPFAWSGSYII